MYIERLKSAIGAMTATLGGVDCLVFTAGIGENSAVVRQLTCNGLGFLGISVDHNLNEGVSSDIDIATPNSRVRIFVIHTQEDWEIAAECWRLTLHHANSHN
jgi:acetate kinase